MKPKHMDGADDAIALYQTITAQEQGEAAAIILDALGLDEASLKQAAELGPPIQVDTAGIITMPKGEVRARALDALRVTPDGVSGTEASQWNPEERINAAFEAAKIHTQTRSEVNKEITRIRSEMVSSGVEMKTAAQFAALHGANAIAMSTAYGIDPVERLKLRNFMSAEYTEAEGEGVEGGLAQGVAHQQGQDALASDVTAWASSIDEINQLNKAPTSPVKMLGQTPLIMQMLGAKQRPIYAAPHMFDGTHTNITPEMLKQIPQALADPIAVFKSKTHSDRLVFMLEVTDASGATVVVPVQLDGKKYRTTMHIATTAYAKEKNGRPDNAWFAKQAEGALYINKAKEKRWLMVSGSNSLWDAASVLSAVNIHTEADLVKLREKNISLYQTQTQTEIPAFYSPLQRAVEGMNLSQIEEAPSNLPAQTMAGELGLQQGTNAPLDSKIPIDGDNVNMLLQEKNAVVRGVTTFPEGRRLITLFTGKWNASTIAHESMHVFLQDLMDIAADNGNAATDTALRTIAGIVQGANNSEPYKAAKATIDAAIDRVANATPDTRMDALNDAVASLKDSARRVTDTAHTTTQSLKDAPASEQHSLKSSITKQHAHSRLLARTANALAKARDHLRGLKTARADIATLREWAGVPVEGTLDKAQYVTLHEAVAQGFEQYLIKGEAPSPKLKSAFARIREWMVAIYKDIRDSLGIPINKDVALVFDRMLATDTQMQQSKELQNRRAVEDEFINSPVFTEDERHEVDANRSLAESEVQAALDKATLRDRNKRWAAAYKEGLEYVEQDYFWEMVSYIANKPKTLPDGSQKQAPRGISRESAIYFLGKDHVNDLIKKRPGLIREDGLGADVVAAEYGYGEDGHIDGAELMELLYDRLVVQGQTKRGLASAYADQALDVQDALASQEASDTGYEATATYFDKVNETLLRIEAKKLYRTQAEQERFVRSLIGPRRIITQRAKETLADTPLRDISPARYQAMLDKALKERNEAMASTHRRRRHCRRIF